MESNKILIFGAGIVLGYLLSKEMAKNQQPVVTTAVAPSPSPSPSPLPPNLDIQAVCQSKLDDAVRVVKVGNLEQYKVDFMKNCISKGGAV